MELVAKRDHSERLIADYRNAIDVNRRRINWCNEMLGRIAQRLREPEEEEPGWD